MKKKILLISLLVAMLLCVLAISVGAYTPAKSYNYYVDSLAEGNLVYSATTKMEPSRGRFEITVDETGDGFAKFDADGNALTWYVVSESTDSEGARHFVCKGVKTIGEAGTVDANGHYTYGGGTETAVTNKNVVSVCFYGTGVKTLPDNVYQVNATNPPHTSEYNVLANGSHLMFLYLPKTLTAFPAYMCQRSSVRIIEFEDNQIAATEIKGAQSNGNSPFAFCGNLKEIRIPEGIQTISQAVFRENCSLKLVKFPSTMTRLEGYSGNPGGGVFFRSNAIETVILSPNMTYATYFNTDAVKMKAQGLDIKYIWVPNTINTANSNFDVYNGISGGLWSGVERNLVFFFVGTLEEAKNVSKYTSSNFKNAITNKHITYEEYLADKTKYDNYTGHILVYDVPYCVAFHDGQHQIEQVNTYKDVLTPFEIGEKCKNCSDMDNITEYAPIIEFVGYSAKIGGNTITLGYKVNKESLALFPELSYGILAVVPGDNADLNAYEPLNLDLTSNVEDYVIAMEVDKKYNDFNIFIDSFDAEYYETPFVMCVYVADGENVDYLCYNDGKIVQSEYAQAFTYKFVAEEFSPKFQVTFTCDSKMGTISGETTQIVAEGNKTTEVTAVANEGYTFIGWSDGTRTAKITYKPEDAANLVAYFTHASTDTEETKGLPVIEINTLNGLSITSKDVYTDCYISLLDTETGNNVVSELAEIKGRGNSTWEKFDKKPYKFKFESKQNLFGYGAEKTWVLLADARDYSLLRNMLALNAGGVMSELGYTSKGQSVELYLNGVYQGVYYLCEQIQVKKNRVNITQEDDEIVQGPADIGWLIEMDAWISEDQGGTSKIPSYGITTDGDVFVRVDDGMYNGYTIKDPEDILYDADGNLKEEFMIYIQAYIKNSLAAVSGDDYNAVCELIDVKSFAQAYIIFDLFKNPDTQYSSVYFYKDVDGKLVAAPLWDFDMSIGNVTHKKNCGTNAQNFRDTTYLWTAQKNTWFRELLEFQEFRDLVGQELVDNAEALRASIAADLEYARAHAEAYKKNFEKWNLIGNTSATEKMGAWSVPNEFKSFEEWEDHLDYIKGYLEASLQNLLSVYPAPAVSEQ